MEKDKDLNEEDIIKSVDTQIKKLQKKRANLANNTLYEKFSWKKFQKGTFSILNPVEWIKSLKEIGLFDIRKLIIYALIIGSIYGYGYVKGIRNKPVHFDMRGKEAHIALNEHVLHILPDGSAQVEEQDGTILKKIKVVDIPQLRKALRPIGFQLEPIGIMGMGMGKNDENQSGIQGEGGAGISWFKFHNFNLDTFITTRGFYPLGTSYKLHKIGLKNSSIGIGGGKGFKGDTRGIFYYRWRF